MKLNPWYFGSIVISLFLIVVLYCNLYLSSLPTSDSMRRQASASHINNVQAITNVNSDYFGELRSKVTKQQYKTALENHKKDYLKRIPFPHAKIDDLFPVNVLDAVSREIPDNPGTKNNNCSRNAKVCIRDHMQNGKGAINAESDFGPATLAMFAYLRSSTFIKFLEDLTSIKGLIPDPHYIGSGIHQTVRDGYLKIHCDANTNKQMAQPPAHRRVNILLFLNEDWKDEYGGHLELWSKDLKYCDQYIRPQFNRLVVFSTTDFTWHGHQTPLNAPKNRSRRSLALYYYTIGPRPNEECFDFDCTRPKSNGVAISHMMKTACDSCLDPKCRRWE